MPLRNLAGFSEGLSNGVQIGNSIRDRIDRRRLVQQELERQDRLDKQAAKEREQSRAERQQQVMLELGLRMMQDQQRRAREQREDKRYREERDYRRGRDSQADTIAADERTYRRGRDTQADTIAAGERDYRHGRDAVADAAAAQQRAMQAIEQQARMAKLFQEFQRSMRNPSGQSVTHREYNEGGGVDTWQEPLEPFLRNRRAQAQQTTDDTSPEAIRRQQIQAELMQLQQARTSGGEFPGPDIIPQLSNSLPLVGDAYRAAYGPGRSAQISQLQRELQAAGGNPDTVQAGQTDVRGPVPVTTREEFEALPSGTPFIYQGRQGVKK